MVVWSFDWTEGRGYAYQVPRSEFDFDLIQVCIKKGVQVSYKTSVIAVQPIDKGYRVTLDCEGERCQISTGFLIDASGFGRVLARLFDLEKPSGLTDRSALFAHIKSDLVSTIYDPNKILIAQTHIDQESWYWLIPFLNGTCSVGVVGDLRNPDCGEGLQEQYQASLEKQSLINDLVGGKEIATKVGCISAYSSSISSLYGDRYVILGNAGEFIDPIFSSGVTIALKSATYAAPLVLETIKGATPDWEGRFSQPLLEGVSTFKEYVAAWYSGILPNLFYAPHRNEEAYQMICSVLAGYVWDRNNPFTRMTQSNLRALLALT